MSAWNASATIEFMRTTTGWGCVPFCLECNSYLCRHCKVPTISITCWNGSIFLSIYLMYDIRLLHTYPTRQHFVRRKRCHFPLNTTPPFWGKETHIVRIGKSAMFKLHLSRVTSAVLNLVPALLMLAPYFIVLYCMPQFHQSEVSSALDREADRTFSAFSASWTPPFWSLLLTGTEGILRCARLRSFQDKKN